jgi:hypothetical protein
VSDVNWTYRLPAPLEDLEADPATRARLGAIGSLVQQARRA